MHKLIYVLAFVILILKLAGVEQAETISWWWPIGLTALGFVIGVIKAALFLNMISEARKGLFL